MADDADIKDPRIANSAAVLPVKSINSVPYIDFRSLTAALAHAGEVFFGTYAGTAAAVEVACPFDPAAVMLINEDLLAEQTHLPSMAAATSFQRITAGTLSLVAANGITLGAKGERKFTAGTAMHADTNVVHFIAFGSRGLGGSD